MGRQKAPKATCYAEACTSPSVTKGLCRRHYQQFRIKSTTALCGKPGCASFVWAKGLCKKHYEQQRIYNEYVQSTQLDTPSCQKS